MTMVIAREQAIAHRLRTAHLDRRLPPGRYVQAARYAIQDSAPRSALLSLHARVEHCAPDAWQAPGLVQTYSPRAAVHVLPDRDFGVFTIGRLPDDPERLRAVRSDADAVCSALGPAWRPTRDLPGELQRRVRPAAATGRIQLRWDATSLRARVIQAPEIDPDLAAAELCRRHLHAFGPTNPVAFAWWAGFPAAQAKRMWQRLAGELLEVRLEDQRAWILAEDEPSFDQDPVISSIRFVPAEELRLFGADRTGLFVAPRSRNVGPYHDWFLPHGLMVDGCIVGSWGRRGGNVTVILDPAIPWTLCEQIEAEALAMPIPGARMSVDITRARDAR